jgi:hypothetical protein
VNGARSSERLGTAVRSARVGYDRAIDLLDRLVPLARRLERTVFVYGLTVGFAVVLTIGSVLVVDVPSEIWTWSALVVAAGLLTIAPVVILLFASMLREALELPQKLRALPDLAPARARDVNELVQEARARPQHERMVSLPRDSWRAGRLLNALRKEVPGVSVVLAIARVPFMILVAVCLVVGAVEVALAPLIVVVAVVATLL